MLDEEKNRIKFDSYMDIMSNNQPLEDKMDGHTMIQVYKDFTYKFSIASGYSWIEENDKVICQRRIHY